MQPSCITVALVSVVVFLSCHLTTVYGKCSGRWAIHACYGGNGKRSGPPMTDSRADMADRDKLSLLEQILLSSYDVPDMALEMAGGPAQQPHLERDTENMAELYPDEVRDADYDRQSELRKTQALLTNLMFGNRFRRSSFQNSANRRR